MLCIWGTHWFIGLDGEGMDDGAGKQRIGLDGMKSWDTLVSVSLCQWTETARLET